MKTLRLTKDGIAYTYTKDKISQNTIITNRNNNKSIKIVGGKNGKSKQNQ